MLTPIVIACLLVAAVLVLWRLLAVLLAVLLADPLPPDTFDVEYDPRDYPCDTH